MLIDLDNTLLDRASAYAGWAAELAAEHAPEADPGPETAWLIDTDGDGFVAREIVAAAIAERYGLDPASLLTTLRAGLVERMTLDPAVGAALTDLRAGGTAVVVVTNGTVAQQERKLRHTGLDALVDGWVISEGVGIRKPDRRIFEAAAQLVDLPLQGWMIGDSAAADIAGGHAAGLRTIWLDRGRGWDPFERAPDVIVPGCVEALMAVAVVR